MVYFGKPNQCYKCHIESVYNSWKKIYEQRGVVISKLCKRYRYSEERFKAATLLAVALHDTGKLSQSFQQAMKIIALEKNSKLFSCETCNATIPVPQMKNQIKPYRHEIISGLAAIYLSNQLNRKIGSLGCGDFSFEFAAIIGHHKPVNPDSFRREWDHFFDQPSNELEMIGFGERQWDYAIKIAANLFNEENIPFPIMPFNEIFKETASTIEIVKNKIDSLPFLLMNTIEDSGETNVIGQLRETLALIKSILVAADWEGSSRQVLHTTVNISADDFWGKFKAEIETNNTKSFKQKKFQKELTRLTGHGIAIAPTGSGKTEGAIAWALSNKMKNEKILYVLPNQVLTNSIYERLSKLFGAENVGLLHSSARLYQMVNRMVGDESEQFDYNNFYPTDAEKSLHTLNRMMFRPIMVATVDQLLMTAFNGNKRWAVVFGEIMGGAIIFDEIHAYDGHMLALLERVSRELRDYSKILFMSATMPENLVSFLSKILGGDPQIIRDKELLNESRNNYQTKWLSTPMVQNGKINNTALKEIKTLISQKKRVAIICNTVKTAQDIYQQFKKDNSIEDKNIMCLHSRFITKDRRTKEKKLEKDKSKAKEQQQWPQILVATQVIECGVDIDYDILFTEGAPLEAIIQRAGRINRERDINNKGQIYIFQQDESSQKFYPPEITKRALQILKNNVEKNKEVTEQGLIDMIEEIYRNDKFEDDLRFLNTRRMLDELIYDIGALQDIPETDLHTRFISYKMVEVVPEQIWNEINGDDQNQFVIMEHLVKMPLWAYLNAKKHNQSEKWKIMSMEYDGHIGGTFKANLNKKMESETFCF